MKNNYLLRSVNADFVKISVVLAGLLLSGQGFAQSGSRVSVPDQRWQKDGMFGGYSPNQEVLSKRTKTTKHFKNANGTFTAQIGADLHYRDASGSWQDVDYTIKPGTVSGFGFENTTNEIKSYFPAKAGSNSVVLQVPQGPSISWWNSPELRVTDNGRELKKLGVAQSSGSVSGKMVRYANVYPGISEEFEVIQDGLENNIVLSSLNAALANNPATSVLEFSQVIKTKGDWDVVADGVKAKGNFTASMFSIKAPAFSEPLFFSPIVIFDNKISREEALSLAFMPKEKRNATQQAKLAAHVLVVKYQVESVKDGLKITTKVPLSWLKASNRAYPVTIDPTVTIGTTTTGEYYAPISHWYGYQRHADLYLQSEVGVYGAISAIEYYKTNTAATRTKPTKVYMRTTPATTLTGTDAWNSNTYTGGLTAAFDGTTTQDNTAGWKMITLTNAFNYTQDNLLVMVYDAYGGSGNTQYIARSTTTARQAYKRQDNTDPGDASATAVENYLPAIRITYVSGPPTINALSATTTCSGTGTFTITGSNFTGATAVTIGNTAVTGYVVNSDTQITVTAGAVASGNVSVTTSGGTSVSNASITVNPSPTVAAIAGGAASVCVGSATAAFTNATAGGTWAVVNGTGSATINAAGVLTGVTAGTVSVTYTVTDGGCSSVATKSATVNALPPALTVNGPSTAVCPGTVQQLTTTGGTMSGTFVNQSFTGSTTLPTGWTAVAGTGDTVVVAATATAGGAANEVVMTGNSQTAVITDRLSYGPFDSTGLTSFNLQWNNYVRHYQSSYVYSVKVQTSTDGTTWHDTSWGTSPVTANIGPGVQNATISNTDVGSATLYIAFTLNGQTFGMYNWSIDNVVITGDIPANIVWTPTTGLYTDAGATTPYTGGNATSVYVQTAVGANYTATATNASGCSVSATSNLNVVAAAAPSATSPQSYTDGQTLADLIVNGSNLTWYSDANGATVIPNTTVLADNTTYYVSQNTSGCESALTAILVQAELGVANPNANVFAVYPNPVRNVVTFSNSSSQINKAEVFNVVGQCVLSKNVAAAQGQLDMTALAKGTYILRLSTETSQKVVKVIKE